MKRKEIIEKLKEGCFIQYSEISYTTRIFLMPKEGSDFISTIRKNNFELLLSSGFIKMESQDNKPMLHPNRTIQRDVRKYVYKEN